MNHGSPKKTDRIISFMLLVLFIAVLVIWAGIEG